MHHNNSISDLQIRLPAVVLGGGLTAVDAATEVLAYYPVQVEKLLLRCKTLEKKYGQNIPQNCNFSSKTLGAVLIPSANKTAHGCMKRYTATTRKLCLNRE